MRGGRTPLPILPVERFSDGDKKIAPMDIDQITALKPRPLEPGATIGIVAPASPFKLEAFERGVALIEGMGFKIRLSNGLFDTQGYLAGPDARRAAQLNEMFRDDAVDAVMCARGGYGSLRIVSMLDFDLIRANPKPFIGFSDITTLHQALLLKTGLVTFHGPMVCTLGRGDESSLSSLRDALVQDRPPNIQIEGAHPIRSGKAHGVFTGGNLSNLCHLIGTPFGAGYRGCLLFLEDVGEALYRIDRMLTHMLLAGCFQGLAGLVLGTFRDCGPWEEIAGLFDRLFADLPIPILGGLAAGHGERNLTLPLGLTATLDADAGSMIFAECK